MFFEQIATGGCQSYLVGCEASRVDHHLGLAGRLGLRVHYVVDTHTRAAALDGGFKAWREAGYPIEASA